MLQAVKAKTLSEITAEWDELAPVRHRQISSGEDISYNQVIAPALLKLLDPVQSTKVLDAGCGTGLFSAMLARKGAKVVGIDPSGRSIEIAKSLPAGQAIFIQSTMEGFPSENLPTFDTVVANMVLMDVLCLESFLAACRRVIADDGKFLFSITHPCFWPEYYGYASGCGFDMRIRSL